MTKCKKCGACCEVICLKVTKKGIREARRNENSEFVLQHWKRVSRKEAERRNPRVAPYVPGYLFYECDQFDTEAKLCQTHNNGKPPVCTGFPFYGKEPYDVFYMLPGCAFKGDLQDE